MGRFTNLNLEVEIIMLAKEKDKPTIWVCIGKQPSNKYNVYVMID
jgi:hypothetical protein